MPATGFTSLDCPNIAVHYFFSAIAILALIAIAVFSIQNLEPVAISFLIWEMSLSKCLLVIAVYVLGMVTGGGLMQLFKRSLGKRKRTSA